MQKRTLDRVILVLSSAIYILSGISDLHSDAAALALWTDTRQCDEGLQRSDCGLGGAFVGLGGALVAAGQSDYRLGGFSLTLGRLTWGS